jgi:MarR family transcriptional regulator for hemolysin
MNENSIGFLLTKVSRVVSRMYQKRLAPHGITAPQSGIIAVLGAANELCQTQIGKELNLDKANTSIMLKRMTEQGLVKSKQDGEDRRKVLYTLTAKGKKLVPVIAKVDHEVSASLNATLGPRLGAQALKMLNGIYEENLE